MRTIFSPLIPNRVCKIYANSSHFILTPKSIYPLFLILHICNSNLGTTLSESTSTAFCPVVTVGLTPACPPPAGPVNGHPQDTKQRGLHLLLILPNNGAGPTRICIIADNKIGLCRCTHHSKSAPKYHKHYGGNMCGSVLGPNISVTHPTSASANCAKIT